MFHPFEGRIGKIFGKAELFSVTIVSLSVMGVNNGG
jgi:hypothetical protein